MGWLLIFFNFQTLSAADLRDPEISALVAAKLIEFHRLEMPGPKNVFLWDRLRYWQFFLTILLVKVYPYGIPDTDLKPLFFLPQKLGWWGQKIVFSERRKGILLGYSGGGNQYAAEGVFTGPPRHWVLSQWFAVRKHNDWWENKGNHYNCMFLTPLWLIQISYCFEMWFADCILPNDFLDSCLDQHTFAYVVMSLLIIFSGLWICKLQPCCLWPSKSLLWNGSELSYRYTSYLRL